MLLDKEKVMLGRNDDLLHWIVLSGLTEALKDEKFADFADHWRGKDKVDIQFLVEGQEIDVEYVCQKWQDQVDRMINEAAVKLLSEKMGEKIGNITDLLYEIEKEVIVLAREKLGMKPDEDRY